MSHWPLCERAHAHVDFPTFFRFIVCAEVSMLEFTVGTMSKVVYWNVTTKFLKAFEIRNQLIRSQCWTTVFLRFVLWFSNDFGSLRLHLLAIWFDWYRWTFLIHWNRIQTIWINYVNVDSLEKQKFCTALEGFSTDITVQMFRILLFVMPNAVRICNQRV